MANILAPHSGSMHPATRKALGKFAPEAEIVATTQDDHAYWREVKSRWTGLADLVIIEQDIEIHEGVIESFLSCQIGCGWCTYAYNGGRNEDGSYVIWDWCLGCVRFSAKFQRVVPADRIDRGNDIPWRQLDNTIKAGIQQIDFMGPGEPNDFGPSPWPQHVHGMVKHHHYECDHEPPIKAGIYGRCQQCIDEGKFTRLPG